MGVKEDFYSQCAMHTECTHEAKLEVKARLLFKHLWCEAILLFKHFGLKARLLLNHLGAKQDFCANVCGTNQDFCSNIWSAKQVFCSNILGAKQSLIEGQHWSKAGKNKKAHKVGLFFWWMRSMSFVKKN